MRKLYKEEKLDLENTTIIDNKTGEVLELKNTISIVCWYFKIGRIVLF